MAEPYLQSLKELLKPVARQLPQGIELTCKHFFGGAAAYANGRICISLTKVGLAMKLPEDERARLLKLGGTPLRYFPKAPIKKQYVVLPRTVRDDANELAIWARTSVDYVYSLP